MLLHTLQRGAIVTLALILALASIAACDASDSTGGKFKLKKIEVQKPSDNKPLIEGNPLEYVKMVTSMGDIVLELNREKAPISVENFLMYTDEDAYDNTIFHRVIGSFMIQGGGFNDDMTKRPTKAEIKNEWGNGLSNMRGTIAMARRGGNIHSATNQFFINVRDNRNLDMKQRDGAGYAVFGKVIEGLDVVDKIKVVKTQKMPPQEIVYQGKKQTVPGPADVPVEPIYIIDVVRIDKPAESAEE